MLGRHQSTQRYGVRKCLLLAYRLENRRELVPFKPIDLAMELAQPRLQRITSIRPGNDAHHHAGLRLAATGDLRGVARAQACGARKGEARQALEDRAFARRLVADDNELRQRDERADVELAQLVDLVEQGLVAQRAAGSKGRLGGFHGEF